MGSPRSVAAAVPVAVSFAFAFAFAFAVARTAAHPPSIGALVEARVIPDVIDEFLPSAEVDVSYGETKVVDGLEIRPSAAAKAPSVRIRGGGCSSRLQSHYTLVMTDPDAPSPSHPWKREWLHWIVVDVPEGRDVTEGKELVPYVGPAPPIGVHRYVFVIFQQTGTLEGIKPPEIRANFKTRTFAAENGLGLPVSALYFNSTKESELLKRN